MNYIQMLMRATVASLRNTAPAEQNWTLFIQNRRPRNTDSKAAHNHNDHKFRDLLTQTNNSQCNWIYANTSITNLICLVGRGWSSWSWPISTKTHHPKQ